MSMTTTCQTPMWKQTRRMTESIVVGIDGKGWVCGRSSQLRGVRFGKLMESETFEDVDMYIYIFAEQRRFELPRLVSKRVRYNQSCHEVYIFSFMMRFKMSSK